MAGLRRLRFVNQYKPVVVNADPVGNMHVAIAVRDEYFFTQLLCSAQRTTSDIFCGRLWLSSSTEASASEVERETGPANAEQSRTYPVSTFNVSATIHALCRTVLRLGNVCIK